MLPDDILMVKAPITGAADDIFILIFREYKAWYFM